MQEIRYYIGLMDRNHVMFKVGPAQSGEFNHGPTELMPLGDNRWAYPVSAEIAEEWVAEDEDVTP